MSGIGRVGAGSDISAFLALIEEKIARVWEIVIIYRFGVIGFNPFTAPACKMSGAEDARTRLQTVYFQSDNTSTFSAMCVLMNAIRVCFEKCYACVFRWTLCMCVSMNAMHVCYTRVFRWTLYMCVVHVCFDERYTCVFWWTLYMCVLTKILSYTRAKKKTKRFKGFQFCPVVGRFQMTSWQWRG